MRTKDPDIGNTHRARVENGRDTRANSAHIRVDTAHAYAGGGGTVANVGVDIDQARHDIPFFGANLEHALRVAHGNVRLNGGDFTVRNTDIHVPVETLARV